MKINTFLHFFFDLSQLEMNALKSFVNSTMNLKMEAEWTLAGDKNGSDGPKV